MIEKLRRRVKEQKGFTLIELLVVVIIIGLLAAIAIPAFLGQREKAQDAAAKSLVRNGQTALEAHFADGQIYTVSAPAVLTAIEPNITWKAGTGAAANNEVGYTTTATTYVLHSKSVSGQDFYIEKGAGGTSFRCKTTGCTSNEW